MSIEYYDHHMVHYEFWRSLSEVERMDEMWRLYHHFWFDFGKPVSSDVLHDELYDKRSLNERLSELNLELEIAMPNYSIQRVNRYPYFVLDQNYDVGKKVPLPDLWRLNHADNDLEPLHSYVTTMTVAEANGTYLKPPISYNEFRVLQLLVDGYQRDPDQSIEKEEFARRIWGEANSGTINSFDSTYNNMRRKLEKVDFGSVEYRFETIRGVGRKLVVN